MFGVEKDRRYLSPEWQPTQHLWPLSNYGYDAWNEHWDAECEELMQEFERGYVHCPLLLPDEEVADSHLAVGEDSVDEDFTPRCVFESTLQKQREAISAQLPTDEDWAGLALMLSPIPPAKKVCQVTPQTLQKERTACLPFPDIPETEDHWAELAALLSPLPPAKKVCQGTKERGACLCPACAGANAKPMVSTCAVCGAQILYSICTKHHAYFFRQAAEPQEPTMCFVCMRVLAL
jgi:hypothetical protein